MPEPVATPPGWDYTPDRRPARSLLAAIEPIGVGTPLAESMAGYIARLSWQHSLAPVRLVRDVLAPALGHPSMPHGDAAAWEEELARVTRHPAASVLGHAPVAGTWADALGVATGRPVLRALTLLAWADVLPKKGLLRAERAWCPACLELWRLRGHPIYEPLLWQVAGVTACAEHEVRLATECPSCGEQSGVLTAWARVGHCRCGTWLGSLWFHEDAFVEGDDLEWQRYVTAQVGSLIATTPSLAAAVAAVHTTEAVAICWERSGLSLTRLARTMGMALSTLSLWKDGRRQPSLPGVLRLCRVAGVDLVDFLSGKLEALRAAPGPSARPPYVRPSQEKHRMHDWIAIRHQLGSVLKAQPPKSLASVLREVGIDTSQAKRECPDECARIAERHHAWVKAQAKERSDRHVELVRAAIAVLRTEGVYPSRHQVQKRLPGSVSLRRSELYAVWVAEGRDPGRTFLKA